MVSGTRASHRSRGARRARRGRGVSCRALLRPRRPPGTRGLRPENPLAAFGKAMEIGVTTLELDTGGPGTASSSSPMSGGSRRGVPGPVRRQADPPADLRAVPEARLGTRHPADPSTHPFVGTQEAVPGTHMPSLAQVFQLVNRYGADHIQFDIETKRDPTLPEETVGPRRSPGRSSPSSRATT